MTGCRRHGSVFARPFPQPDVSVTAWHFPARPVFAPGGLPSVRSVRSAPSRAWNGRRVSEWRRRRVRHREVRAADVG